MNNQTLILSLQGLVMETEKLKTYNPKSIENIFNRLKQLPELHTSRTKNLLKDLVTEKNWINIKYNLLDEMVKKIGDFLTV
ncbi:hypothetical protein QWY86_04485 [Pedobacter aquatilis]|uniref:hypothetical protein n=1 Tax=Pedobacter aquatilis TaxID=351343 RepID=UPI0025B38D18|nr:hypothetical protein [Pedobacter aquatilis]MDN3585911.1 hypothetical protein [Pedobacter aquatilis]